MRVRDFIVAEDIRTEVGNKHSLIGVLADDFAFGPALPPAAMKLGFFLRLELAPADPDAFAFEFRVAMDGQDLVAFNGSGGKTPGAGLLALPLVANLLPFPGSGMLTFKLRVTEQPSGKPLLETTELRAVKVTLVPPPGPPSEKPKSTE